MLITLPITITLSRKKGDKQVPLNLNWYRNAHHITKNNIKQLFKERVYLDNPLLKKLVVSAYPIALRYDLYWSSNRQVDVANVLSIVDKFFCDALEEEGVLKDDSFKYISQVIYNFKGIDKENPRVEVVIENS